MAAAGADDFPGCRHRRWRRAPAWPQRTWAVEGVGGMSHPLAQQLLSAGERVLDVQPKLGALGPAAPVAAERDATPARASARAELVPGAPFLVGYLRLA